MSRSAPARLSQALQGVNGGPFCRGCGLPFTRIRATQQHCKPSCRVLACRRRKSDHDRERLASGIAAGHVEPDVMP
jgi:hypothetical protein